MNLSLFKETGLRWLWLSFLFLIIDQVTKQWVVATFDLYESVQVLPFFNLTYVHNLGAAFSFLSDAGGWQRWFFAAVAFLVSVALIVWLGKTRLTEQKLCIAYALILGGALGNLIDRVLFGYVIDFIHVYYENWHYPAFNIADSAICVGAGLLIWDAFTNNNENSNDELSKEK
ncbi:signal peptidase II [Flocculibacter collagenilyticus]|uniref:signal peptidase II n=1 Tax=Flocculibacter collagenilyticus TaxID=2744479 RepID=UPI0018F4623C|nr:signal peptidase II [Flocculibacter collagenilyticus]